MIAKRPGYKVLCGRGARIRTGEPKRVKPLTTLGLRNPIPPDATIYEKTFMPQRLEKLAEAWEAPPPRLRSTLSVLIDQILDDI